MLELTHNQAKPMIKIGGQSLIHRIIDQLVEYGIEKIVINTFYEAEKLEEHIRSYARFYEVDIEMVREEELLETGGGIINMLPCLKKEPFFVVNGDALLVGENVFQFLNSCWLDEMKSLFLLFDQSHAVGYRGIGDFALDSQGKILTNGVGDGKDKYVFSGVHIATHANFDGLPVKPMKLIDIYSMINYDRMYGVSFDRASFLHVGDKGAVEEAESFLLEHNK